MDGAIHTPSAGQSRVGRIHDGVSRDARDIAFQQDEAASAGTCPLHIIYYNRFVTRREFPIAVAACASQAWARSHWDRTRIAAITDELGNTADDAIDLAHEIGLWWVELRNLPGTSKAYAQARDADIQAAATRLTNARMKVSCVDAGFMEDISQALRCAHLCGADRVRIFAHARTTGQAPALDALAAALAEMAAEADGQKITLLLANHPASSVATCAEMAAVMKLVPSRALAIEWNPHSARGREQPFPDGYALLPKKRILNVRAEAAGLNPGVPGSEDWRAILQALDRDGYAGRIVLETGATGPSRIAATRDAIEELAHIVREVS